jgi:hypothetical protein
MRTGGRTLVETTFSLDIRPLVRKGGIRDDIHAIGTIGFGPDDEDDDDYAYGVPGIAFEVSTLDHANRWIRLRCTFTNHWSAKRREIDDKISLATAPLPCGRKWWFVCPALGRPVRALYLPGGARHFRSRQAYNLAYETEHLDDRERAWRRIRKCRRQLDSPPEGLGAPYPEKPPGMRSARYAWLLTRLHAAEADLSLPLTLSGPRFAYRWDRQSGDSG